MEKSLDKLKKEVDMEKTEEDNLKKKEKMEKSEEERRSTEECLRAYQISLTYANTPGR